MILFELNSSCDHREPIITVSCTLSLLSCTQVVLTFLRSDHFDSHMYCRVVMMFKVGKLMDESLDSFLRAGQGS